MVSETALEILRLENEPPSRDEVAKAFWLRTEEIDRAIVNAASDEEVRRLLREKDQLLEARALLEGISFSEIQRQILERKPAQPSARKMLIALAIIGWIVAIVVLFVALGSQR